MKRILLIAFFLGCIISCKKVERTVHIQDVPIQITLREIVSQTDEIRLKFSHDGGSSTLTGIVHADDSTALLKKMGGHDHEMLTLPSDELFSYTFKRSSNSGKVYFAFYLEQEQTGKYTEVHSFNYSDFDILEQGIDEDGVLKSVFSSQNDFDVYYEFQNGFDGLEELQIFIDDQEIAFTPKRTSISSLTFKIPESFKSGTYTYRVRYRGNDIILRKLYLPEGRLKLATVHPQKNEFPYGYYVFQDKLCFILFVHGGDNNKLEYASWDPASGVWEQEGRFVEENTIPLIGNFEGKEINGRIYFPPSSQYVNDDKGEKRVYFMHSYDPVAKDWKREPIKELEDLLYAQTFTAQNVLTYKEKLLVFLYGDDGSSPTNLHHLYEFDPETYRFTSLGNIRLPNKTMSSTFLRNGDDFYIVATLEYYHPYYGTEHEVKIYQTDINLRSLKLLSTIPALGYGNSSTIVDNQIYVYGAFLSGRFLPIVPFGAKFDLRSNEWEHLNPTYSNFGLNSSYSRQLAAINNRLFDVGLHQGEVIEWDVSFRAVQ